MHGKEDVEIENALQPLKEKQHAQYIQVVQDAIKAEEKRKNKLQKVTSNLEAKRLEKNFIKERQFDKEKLIQLQQDHVLLIHAKRQELLAMKEKGIKPTLEEKITGRKSIVNKMATSQNKEKHSEPVKFTKQSLERLMQPCNKFTTNVTTDNQERSRSNLSSSSSSRLNASTSQELAFYKDLYKKQDKLLFKNMSSTSKLTSVNLNKLSETELLEKKMTLLSQLHTVVCQQERILIDDGQFTVRSSVSSFKSSKFQ